MVEKAYAKINLGLNVLGKREDGYHNIETIMLPLELHDTIDISVMKDEDSDDFVTCDDYSIKVLKYNLCHKAIDLCREKWHFKEKLRVEIHKRIFIQSGLGGGSADAAATVRGIIKLLNIDASEDDIKEITIQLGSDVPWCYYNLPSVTRDKGETLEFFKHNRNDFILIVQYPIGLSTKEVFTKSDEFELKNHDLNDIKDKFINDEKIDADCINSLETVSFEMLPELKSLKDDLLSDGFDYVTMTGSGSAIIGLTKNKKILKAAANKYYKRGLHVEETKFKI